jgi:hypothetical protein
MVVGKEIEGVASALVELVGDFEFDDRPRLHVVEFEAVGKAVPFGQVGVALVDIAFRPLFVALSQRLYGAVLELLVLDLAVPEVDAGQRVLVQIAGPRRLVNTSLV